MNWRMNAAKVLARRRILETLITPGYYIALVIGLLLGYYLINGFTVSIDSSGFNFQLHPIYDLIARSLSGAFGATYVEKLFAEGPFLLAFYVSFTPVFLFLAVNTVFRFGLEKKVGAVELVAYGPADGTSYFLASFIKDVLLTVVTIVIMLVFLSIAAAFNNLVLGPKFFYALVSVFFLSMAVYAYGILSSTLTDNSASSTALFVGIMVFFLMIMMGSFTIVSGYVQNLANVLAWLVKWLSPIFYWNLSSVAVEVGAAVLFLISLALLLVLSAAVLAVSHFVLKIRGVRI